MSRSRGERRHHHDRMIDRVRKFSWLQPKPWDSPDYDIEKHIKKVAENRKKCSCEMCCNPRHSGFAKGERLTMQERRMKEYERYEE